MDAALTLEERRGRCPARRHQRHIRIRGRRNRRSITHAHTRKRILRPALDSELDRHAPYLDAYSPEGETNVSEVAGTRPVACNCPKFSLLMVR